jgi:hypothetical protein
LTLPRFLTLSISFLFNAPEASIQADIPLSAFRFPLSAFRFPLPAFRYIRELKGGNLGNSITLRN